MTEDRDFYKDLIDNLYDGVYFVDGERVITYWNKGAERITGYGANQVVGRSCRDNLLNHVTADGVQLCLGGCPLSACMEDGNVRQAEVFLHHASGYRVPVMVRVSPIRSSSGAIVGAVETFNSAMETMELRQQIGELRRTTRTDALTGIGNRLYLEGRLRALVSEFEGRSPSGGLLFIDIDHFKQLNDLYGHEAGDRVLRMVASTLYHNMRKTDVVGRWGGEEFLAIVYDVISSEELGSIAEKLRTLVAFSRIDLPAASLSVTISVGATLLLNTDTSESIVRRADELMYRSKLAGRNQVSEG
jgi:diguanylate cyclase (GGDEF)-like protein/PAS domain S-box-containing protein